MADVLIHRCRLRVVRRGGWSWGPSPKQVAEQAVKIFPLLLEKKLAELIPDHETREYSAPVQLRLRVRMEELMENVVRDVALSGFQEFQVSQTFAARMEEALRAAFVIPAEVTANPQLPQRIPAQPQALDSPPTTDGYGGNAIARQLLGWLTACTLELRLSEFSVAELESWAEALRLRSVVESEFAPQQLVAIREEVELYLACLRLPVPFDRAVRIKQQLILATRTAAQLAIDLSSRQLWQQIEKTIPLDSGVTIKQDSAARVQDAEQPKRTSLLSQSISDQLESFVADSRGSAAPSQRLLKVSWDAHISTALPFLLLAPLSRIGYFETLSAVLQAAKLEKVASVFAAALAYKVLAPPERGWRRTGRAELAANSFAGTDGQISDESIEEFSRNISKHVGPIERLLTERVIEGHATGSPVVLLRVESHSLKGFLLVDFPGCFPFALAQSVEELAALLAQMQKPVVVISQDTADASIFNGFHENGITFVTDARPGRGEPWERVPRMLDPICWTNSGQRDSTEIVHASSHLAAVSDDSRSFWQEFGASRPSVVRASLPDLERLATLSAAVALGILSWKLWNTRSRTTPQLALERFSDLDARVRFESGTVVVRLPMGRRYQELWESGLLQPVAGVPWLAGRRVEFSGG